eukprot:83312-Chlamydomonas_euryale.AAC.13
MKEGLVGGKAGSEPRPNSRHLLAPIYTRLSFGGQYTRAWALGDNIHANEPCGTCAGLTPDSDTHPLRERIPKSTPPTAHPPACRSAHPTHGTFHSLAGFPGASLPTQRPPHPRTRCDALREALDDRRLADAALSHHHWVVLGAAAEDVHQAAHLLVTRNHRVQLAQAGGLHAESVGKKGVSGC